jgi:superfamily II DNA or RNA helicase
VGSTDPLDDLVQHLWGTFPLVFHAHQKLALRCLIQAWRNGYRAPVFVAPTGSGKTRFMIAMADLFTRIGASVLVLVHSEELLKLWTREFQRVGIEPGVIAARYPSHPERLVQIGMVQTCAKRASGKLPAFQAILIDEAHHAVATSWRNVIAASQPSLVVGCTATPIRLDGKGLGLSVGGVFDSLYEIAAVAELTAQGVLSPVVAYAAPTKKLDLRGLRDVGGDWERGALYRRIRKADIEGDVVLEYTRRVGGKRALAFGVTVEHIEKIAATFNAAGIPAAALHARVSMVERVRRMQAFEAGDILVLSSCQILGEGIDVPAVEAVLGVRPTKSLTVYRQQVGRGLRVFPSKSHLVLLDFVGNIERHDLPDTDIAWSLDGVQPRVSRGVAPRWVCSACGEPNPLSEEFCQDCGHQRERRDRQLSEDASVELLEVRAVEKARQAAAAEAAREQAARDAAARAVQEALRRAQETAQRAQRDDRLAAEAWASQQAQEAQRAADRAQYCHEQQADWQRLNREWEDDIEDAFERHRVGRLRFAQLGGNYATMRPWLDQRQDLFRSREHTNHEIRLYRLWHGYKRGWEWRVHQERYAHYGY